MARQLNYKVYLEKETAPNSQKGPDKTRARGKELVY